MRRVLVVLGLAVAGLVPAHTATAASITFQSQNVTLGGCQTPDCSFSVDLLAQDFTDPFIGLVLNFSFDTTILSLTSVVQGAFLSSGGTGGFDASPLPGADFQTITKFVDLSSPAISGSGVLATLNFIPSAAGNAALALLVSGVTSDGRIVNTEYLTEAGEVLNPILAPGVISIQNPQAVPEPGTLGLFGIGLLSLGRRLRRKTLRP